LGAAPLCQRLRSVNRNPWRRGRLAQRSR
jgi:hypothetical protein